VLSDDGPPFAEMGFLPDATECAPWRGRRQSCGECGARGPVQDDHAAPWFLSEIKVSTSQDQIKVSADRRAQVAFC